MVDFAAARMNMVDSQLHTNRVWDRQVLAAFENVPRERFVPQEKQGIAYVDEDLAIGGGRYLMEPMVLARLLQTAAVARTDVVLEIGCATGYASAILARLAATVVAVESDEGLAAQASSLLTELGIDNVVVVQAPLIEGYAKQAPYNVILLNGAVADVPQPITDQLADGGRLVTVVRNGMGLGRATLMRRAGNVVSGRAIFDAATPLLPGFAREPGFVF